MTTNVRLTDHATADDFAKWQEHARGLDEASLRYIVRDCRQAERAIEGHNPVKAGYYADEAMTYADELRRRS